MDLAEALTDGLEAKTVFTVFGINISEATVVTWIIMAVIVALCIFMTRNLKVQNISKRQAMIEYIVVKLEGLIVDITGEEGKRYAPYLITVMIYLAFANIIGVFSFKPPTKSLNVTAALAIMSIVIVQYAGIHARGVKGWIKSFAYPIGIIAVFNVMDLFTRPLSLCMRLFGNILGAFVIMEIVDFVIPVIFPAGLSLYFDFFDGLLQAYVFTFLTSIYIKEAIGAE